MSATLIDWCRWENKIYVLVCGGIPGVEIRQVKKLVLSLDIEVSTEDFFDPHYLTRNLGTSIETQSRVLVHRC